MPLCQQTISPDDTVESDGYRVAHVDCVRPRGLSAEEHVLLYVFCWNHAVAECASCARSFRQKELGADPFDSRTNGCLHCGADLTESIRAHLTACAILPEPLRQKVKEASEITQRLIKQSYQLWECADVLMRTAEAGLEPNSKKRESVDVEIALTIEAASTKSPWGWFSAEDT